MNDANETRGEAPMSHDPKRLSRLEAWCVARLSAGDVPSWLRGWANARVARSPAARSAYDALVVAEQVAAQRDVTLGQKSQIEAALFAALPAESARTDGRWGVLLSSGVAAAAVVAFFVATPSTPSPSTPSPTASLPADDVLVARAASTGTLGVTVRCLDRAETPAVTGRVAAGPGQPSKTLRCAGDGLMGFAFTNTTSEKVHALVVGLTEDDQLRWYAPFTPGGASVVVPPGAADRLLPTVADLRPMAKEERVVLRAIFSSVPLRADVVEAIVKQDRERGLSPSRVDRLALPATQQARVELEILPLHEDPGSP